MDNKTDEDYYKIELPQKPVDKVIEAGKEIGKKNS